MPPLAYHLLRLEQTAAENNDWGHALIFGVAITEGLSPTGRFASIVAGTHRITHETNRVDTTRYQVLDAL